MTRARYVGSVAAVGLVCGCFIQPVGTTRVAYVQPAPQPSGPVMQAQYVPNAYPTVPQPEVVQPAAQPMPVMHPVGQVVVQPAPAAEYGNVVQVVNGSGGQICYLYISEAGEDWGEDLLGDDTLEAGRSISLSLGDASRWDLLAEDCDHAEITRYANRRLPSDGVWTLTDDGSGRVRSHGDEPAYVASSSDGYGDDDDEEDDDDDEPSTSGGATADDSCRLCDISNGQVFSCGSWYQGDAVVCP
jgi:hypothetical protein